MRSIIGPGSWAGEVGPDSELSARDSIGVASQLFSERWNPYLDPNHEGGVFVVGRCERDVRDILVTHNMGTPPVTATDYCPGDQSVKVPIRKLPRAGDQEDAKKMELLLGRDMMMGFNERSLRHEAHIQQVVDWE